MRFMLFVKSNPDFEAERTPAPDEQLLREMVAYHEQLARAGVLLDAAGLRPSRDGFRVQYGADAPRIVDGPFAEAKELVAGYTLIQVRSRDEALEWARRFPNPVGPGQPAVVEVRPLYDHEDFPGSDAMASFRDIVPS